MDEPCTKSTVPLGAPEDGADTGDELLRAGIPGFRVVEEWVVTERGLLYPLLALEPGVVGLGGQAGGDERLRDRLGVLARPRVDDRRAHRRVAQAVLEQLQATCPAARLDGVEDEVRAVEAGVHLDGIAEREALTDIGLHPRGCCRRQRQAGRVIEFLAQTPELHVVGPEVMAPLGDAMRFVDDEERHEAFPHQTQKSFVLNPLRRHIEQFEALQVEPLDHVVSLLLGQTGVKGGGGDVALFEALDLILHQGDEG